MKIVVTIDGPDAELVLNELVSNAQFEQHEVSIVVEGAMTNDCVYEKS